MLPCNVLGMCTEVSLALALAAANVATLASDEASIAGKPEVVKACEGAWTFFASTAGCPASLYPNITSIQ